MGGILAMRSLVEAAAAYAHGETTDQAFTQVVRALMSKVGAGGK